MTSNPPATAPDDPWAGGPSVFEQPTVRIRALRSTRARRPAPQPPMPRPPMSRPPMSRPPPGGWRGLLTGASLVAVALVPGAVMAAGAITVAANAVCGSGSFCLYSGPDFTGARVEYDAEQRFCQGARPGLDVLSVLPGGIRSVYNNTGTASDGLGVKIYSRLGRLTLPTVLPGHEVRTVDADAARDMHTLCVYPRPAAPAR